jgi:hypothetical protein
MSDNDMDRQVAETQPESYWHPQGPMRKERIMNVAAVKTTALGFSKKFRAGKFERVGSDFLEEVEADIESIVRMINNTQPAEEIKDIPAMTFVSGAFMEKIETAINALVMRKIYAKVKRHPTVGKTLGRTL